MKKFMLSAHFPWMTRQNDASNVFCPHKPIFLYYKMIRKYIIGILCLLSLVACTEKDRLLEQALEQAGNNRVELEKVLNRYRDSDKEKYRAACFLIRNMPFYGLAVIS